MRPVYLTLATLAVGGALAGLLVVFLGLFNVSARNGHWPGVSWVLHTTYRNAVTRRAPDASAAPDMTDDDLVALGARHYDIACAGCHARPGTDQGQTIESMVPMPPGIQDAVSDWQPRHLFWIVAEGIKMSGMPHWPSRVRQDDVWSVVAFLHRVESMSARQYRALVAPVEMTAATTAIAACIACHGSDGKSFGNAHIPRLDLQQPEYLAASLQAYRVGERYSGVMQQAASQLSTSQIESMARHYGEQPLAATADSTGGGGAVGQRAPGSAIDRQAIERGEVIASGGESARDIPSCVACHGPWPEPLSADFPSIAGQHERFLLTQLRLWKAGTRGGTALSRMMHQVVPELNDDQMQDLARYYANLAPVKQSVRVGVESAQ